MTILVTGGTGQVGFELQRALAPFGEIMAPPQRDLDLSNARQITRFLSATKPRWIINAAAYTAVDKAEEETEQAEALNARLPGSLARFAADHGIWLIHYSSDYVYPGDGAKARMEDDPTGPLSVYGQTKLAGDQAVTQSGARHLIFRTSWVYSARGRNFMKTMLRLGAEKDALRIVSDQHGSPTPARLIAQVTALAMYRLRGTADPDILQGIYHLVPRGVTTWHRFAKEIFERAAAMGLQLRIRPEAVGETATADYPTPAERPLNSRLTVEKLEHSLGIRMPGWQLQLDQTLAEFLETGQ